MDNPIEHIAGSLKHLRSKRGWSLTKSASETGVSKAMLGQIERGESSPTISTLWKIATGFNVSLSSLLDYLPEEEERAVTLVRDAGKVRQNIADDGMLVAPLFPYDARVGFEYFELTFPAGYERLSAAHKSGVMEYITVMKGELEVLSEEKWHRVEQGQSIRFLADRPHGYKNASAEPAVILSVIYYPHR